MIDCVAIGDSIAVGVSPYLQCSETRAAIGLTSSRIVDITPGVWHKYCIISAGSNDAVNANGYPVHLLENIQHIRNQSQCQFYVWIEPSNNYMADQVIYNEAVKKNHDVAVSYIAGSDGVHPASYATLAGTILKATGN